MQRMLVRFDISIFWLKPGSMQSFQEMLPSDDRVVIILHGIGIPLPSLSTSPADVFVLCGFALMEVSTSNHTVRTLRGSK
jgi:hypothetical protein